jgi:hypothetical protein
MRLARLRLRIAAFAGAATLAFGLTAVSIPAAHASVKAFEICQLSSGKCLNYDGSYFFSILGELPNPIDPAETPYYEYQSLTTSGLPQSPEEVCLQTNVADTTLTYGTCEEKQRQFFGYDNATLLINYYYYLTSPYRCEAYVTGKGDYAMGTFEGSYPNDAWSINPVTIES